MTPLVLQLTVISVLSFLVQIDAWSSTRRFAATRAASSGSQYQHVTVRLHESQLPTEEKVDYEDVDAPADVAGAEFFGGNTEKRELYDPVAEAKAGEELVLGGTLDRFAVTTGAFDSEMTASLAKSLQLQFSGSINTSTEESLKISYAPSLTWETPFSKTSNQPLQELDQARQFYRQIHVAITGGRALSPTEYEFYWEISLIWPIFWEPRVLLTGHSRLTVVTNNGDSLQQQITRQIDSLDHPDLLSGIASQWVPRFWDVYHIGMSPSAELNPTFQLPNKSLFSRYELLSLPPRWYVEASLVDLWEREEGTASTLPNHAFATIIKTMGPTRQDYTTCSPVQVTIQPQPSTQQRIITWHIPIAVETLAANTDLPLPGPDEEQSPAAQPQATYVWRPRRNVATIPYDGQPQDESIANVRKQLYDSVVVKDGRKPKLDQNGRPIFFYWQDSAKACYTSNGLGMAVYEWRAKFTKPARIGIELEPQQEGA